MIQFDLLNIIVISQRLSSEFGRASHSRFLHVAVNAMCNYIEENSFKLKTEAFSPI
jgi:hypothetical protein